MFNSISGTITGKFPQKLLIETNGVEWDIACPDSTLDKIGAVGETARIYVWLQHTDMIMMLFGFATESDRSLFFDLLKVEGIGPKGALKILNNIDSMALVKILESADVAALEKVPGVGKKTAAKMILALKGKLSLSEAEPSVQKTPGPYADVIQALCDMGYDKKAVEQCIERVEARLSEQEKFSAMDRSAREDAVFRAAIVEMAK